MRRDPLSPGLRSLLDAPSPGTLTLHREDGEAITRPVRGLQVQGNASSPDEEAREAWAWDLADKLP